MQLWNKVRIFSLFIRLILNPNRTELIFKGVRIFANDPNQETVQRIEKKVLSDEGFRKMYEQKYSPPTPSLADLQSCPEGSFGRGVYSHMHNNNLDFDLWPKIEGERPVEYLMGRIYQDHDLWHVLLNCDVSVEDELALQAFNVAQFGSPVALLLIAGGLLRLLGKGPQNAIQAFKKINEIYTLGQRTPFLLGLRIHDLFRLPLDEARRICGIERVPAAREQVQHLVTATA